MSESVSSIISFAAVDSFILRKEDAELLPSAAETLQIDIVAVEVRHTAERIPAMIFVLIFLFVVFHNQHSFIGNVFYLRTV